MTLKQDLLAIADAAGAVEIARDLALADVTAKAQTIADLNTLLKQKDGQIAVLTADLVECRDDPVPIPTPTPTPTPTPIPTPGTWPTGGILVPPGQLSSLVNANPAGTMFRLAGTHNFTASLVLKGGNKYIADDPTKIPKLIGGGNGSFPFCKANVGGVMLKGLDISKFGPADSSEGAGMINRADGDSAGIDWLIEDCNIGDTNNNGVRWGPGWVLRRTRIHDCGRYAQSGGTYTGIKKIFGVEWYHCGYLASDSNRGGAKFAVTSGIEIDGLWTHGHKGTGLWFDIKNAKAKLKGVTSEDNTRCGIFLEVSYGPFEIIDPIIRRCGSDKSGEPADWPTPAGILMSMTPDITITNPLVEDCRNGITIVQWNHPQVLGVKDGQPFGSLDASKCGNENIIINGGKVTRSTEYDAGLAGTKPARAGRPTRNIHYNGTVFDADAKFKSALHVN